MTTSLGASVVDTDDHDHDARAPRPRAFVRLTYKLRSRHSRQARAFEDASRRRASFRKPPTRATMTEAPGGASYWSDLDDWEEWNPERGISWRTHAFAGSVAGLVEHVMLYPIDTVRTQAQVQTVGCPPMTMIGCMRGMMTMIGCMRGMVRDGGLRRLWRGCSTMLSACIPAHAGFFSVYEVAKVATDTRAGEHNPVGSALAGGLATVTHDIIMNPSDVCKQRLQIGHYKGFPDALRTIWREEGVVALYRSLPTALVTNVPYNAVMVMANDACKTFLNPSGEQDLFVFLVSGLVGGATASFLTTPLDVARTRLQTQGLSALCIEGCSTISPEKLKVAQVTAQEGKIFPSSSGATTTSPKRSFSSSSRALPTGLNSSSASLMTYNSLPTHGMMWTKGPGIRSISSVSEEPLRAPIVYRGLWSALQSLYMEEGVTGLFRGWKPRLLFRAPSAAISWATYETMKRALVGAETSQSSADSL
eukprot:g48688.t1